MIPGEIKSHTRYHARLACLEPGERMECYRDRLGWWYLDGGQWVSRSFNPDEVYPILGVNYSDRDKCGI